MMRFTAPGMCVVKGLLALAALTMAPVMAAVSSVDVGKAGAAPATQTPGSSKAAVGRTGLDDRIRTTADENPVRTGKRGAAGKYQMRCWQYGRLVLEESRDTLLSESARVLTVARSPEPGEMVQLVDLASLSCSLTLAP